MSKNLICFFHIDHHNLGMMSHNLWVKFRRIAECTIKTLYHVYFRWTSEVPVIVLNQSQAYHYLSSHAEKGRMSAAYTITPAECVVLRYSTPDFVWLMIHNWPTITSLNKCQQRSWNTGYHVLSGDYSTWETDIVLFQRCTVWTVH